MTALPGHPHLALRSGRLALEGLDLAALAEEFGTPLYAYSRTSMLAALASYRKALDGRRHLICYAMKANSNLAVLETFVSQGCGIDVVSGGELRRAIAAGADPSRIVFSGVGKTADEMLQALHAGVLCFNVESESELAVLDRVARESGRRAPISLRVNPDVDPKTHPYIATGLESSKFGIAHSRAREVYRRAAGLPGIEVAGIDFHIGSQITSIEPYIEAVDRLLDLVETIEADGIPIGHLDLGGGLGIAYSNETPPRAEDLIAAVLARIDERGHGHRELLFEPGRSLVGNAGVLLTRVLYLKDAGSRNFCIVDAAMNDLVRPAMYQAWMRIEACVRRNDPSRIWDVVGPVCESGDWLGKDRPLAVREGDFLAVLSAGAYGMAMAGNYNTRARAAEVMVESGLAKLIRPRESIDAIFAFERRWTD